MPVDARDLRPDLWPNRTPTQHPFAAVLGCSDARVPIELIFNEGPNDLFVVRVAGNVLGTDVLGSLKFAVEHLNGSVKLIVVLGTWRMRRVTSAVDVFLDPGDYLVPRDEAFAQHSGSFAGRDSDVRKEVGFTAFGPEVAHRPRYRGALIEASIVTNAALAAYSIQQGVAD